MSYGKNRCPQCGRSRGSMRHKVSCLGKSRSAERAKNRQADSRRRAGLIRGQASWWGGGSSSAPAAPAAAPAGIVANGSYYDTAKAEVPA